MRTPVVVALGLLLVLAACGTSPVDVGAPPGGDQPPTADPGTGSDEPSSSQPTDPIDTMALQIYFVRATDTHLFVEPEEHEVARDVAVGRAAMEALFEGTPRSSALTNEVPSTARVLATNLRDGVLIVDLSPEARERGGSSAQETAFAQQLAHTAAALDGVRAVELWVDGAPVTELWGHLDWSRPVEPDPDAVSPITFAEPPDGGEVRVGTITVRGEARVFEATFALRLYDAQGALVFEDFVMASDGAPARGTWSTTLTLREPGIYSVEATEDDPSDGEGRAPFRTTLTIKAG